MAKRTEERKDRYFQLHHYMLKTDTWRALSAPARAVYVQLGSRYNGSNNGKLALSVRDAAEECDLAKNTAMRAFKELVDLGFIEETRHGSLSRKTRVASEWRLTAFRCDLTGNLSSKLFMQRGAQARVHRVARSRPNAATTTLHSKRRPVSNDGTACLKRRSPVSQTTVQLVSNDGTGEGPSVSNDGTDEAVLGGSPVSNDGTHIIYHPLPDGGAPPEPPPADTPTPAGAAPPPDAIAPTEEPWTLVADGLAQRVVERGNGKVVAITMVRLPAGMTSWPTPPPASPAPSDTEPWAEDDREDEAAEERSKWSK